MWLTNVAMLFNAEVERHKELLERCPCTTRWIGRRAWDEAGAVARVSR